VAPVAGPSRDAITLSKADATSRLGEVGMRLIEPRREGAERSPLHEPSRISGGLAVLFPKMRDVEGTPTGEIPRLEAMVSALEHLLGVTEPPSGLIREQAQRVLGDSAAHWEAAPTAKLAYTIRMWVAVVGLILLLVLITLGAWIPALKLATLGLVVSFSIAALDRSERVHRGFELGREWLFGISPRAGLAVVGAGLALVALTVYRGVFWDWAFLIGLGLVLAIAYELGLGRRAAAERLVAIEPARRLLRGLRLGGYREGDLIDLVATVDEGMSRRFQQVLLSGPPGSDHASPVGRAILDLETLIRFLERRRLRQGDRSARPILERVEEARLASQGINLLTARRKARRIAKAEVAAAREWRARRSWESWAQRTEGLASKPTASLSLADALRQAIEDPESLLVEHEPHPGFLTRRAEDLARLGFGRLTRLLLAVLLLGRFAFWLDHKGIVTFDQARAATAEVARVVRSAVEARDPGLLRQLARDVEVEWSRLEEPLDVAALPDWISKRIAGLGLAAAGLALLLSLLSGRWIAGLLATTGAALALLGPAFFAAAGAGPDDVGATPGPGLIRLCSLAGVALAVIGLVLRKRHVET
jgi:hypothetical protein